MFPLFGYSSSSVVDPVVAEKLKQLEKSRVEAEQARKEVQSNLAVAGAEANTTGFFSSIWWAFERTRDVILGPGRYAPTNFSSLLQIRPINVILVSEKEISETKLKLRHTETVKYVPPKLKLQQEIDLFFERRRLRESIASENYQQIVSENEDQDTIEKIGAHPLPLQTVSSSSLRE